MKALVSFLIYWTVLLKKCFYEYVLNKFKSNVSLDTWNVQNNKSVQIWTYISHFYSDMKFRRILTILSYLPTYAFIFSLPEFFTNITFFHHQFCPNFDNWIIQHLSFEIFGNYKLEAMPYFKEIRAPTLLSHLDFFLVRTLLPVLQKDQFLQNRFMRSL